MGKRLYGKVTKENVEYEWKAEPGACEVCRAMDGTIYESANDIPDRPHPNCKCWIDVLEKDKDTTDPIELYKEKRKDRKRNELELAKLLGDAKSLEEEIDEYITQINKQEKEIKELESKIDINRLEQKDRQQVETTKEQIDFAKYKANKAKQEVNNIKINIKHANATIEEISKLQFEFNNLKEKFDDFGKNLFDRIIGIIGILTKLDESLALWELSYSKFKEGNDYINKNGRVYNKISDIKNSKIQNFVQNKVEEQMNTKTSRGLVFSSNSSLAQKIVKSNAIKKYIRDNKAKFKPGVELAQTSLDFNIFNPDLFNALHKADIIDIKIDSDSNFTAKIIDTYDFNKYSINPIVKMAGHYQSKDKIENYYTITEIKIPKSVWEKF